MGLAFWMAWNTIAFSGSFWLHDIENSYAAEMLKLVHLAASVVTLSTCALTTKRSTRLIIDDRFLVAGALVASLGTVGIIGSRLPDQDTALVTFVISCVLSGAGTTVLFMRATMLFGSVPPRRAAALLALCAMLSSGIYFALAGVDERVANAGFVLLPILAVPFLLLHGKSSLSKERSLRTDATLTKGIVVFFLSVLLCSGAFEIMRSYALVGIPPSYAIESVHNSSFIEIVIMLGLVASLLVTEGYRNRFVHLYSGAGALIVLMLVLIVTISPNTVLTSSIAIAGTSLYNLVIWSMLAYVVYQSQSSSVFVFGLGNAVLSLGTVVGIVVIMAYHQKLFGDAVMQGLIVFVVASVLLCSLFVFNERRMDELILPIEEERAETAVFGEEAKRLPRHWVSECRRIASDHGLSARETEVFIELARGRSAQETADAQVVSIYTVRAHTRAIYAKLEIHSKHELADLVKREREAAR